MKENQPTNPESTNAFDLEAHEQRLAVWKGKLAVRGAFEQMMQEVDAGKMDRNDAIKAMSSVMGMINRYGTTQE